MLLASGNNQDLGPVEMPSPTVIPEITETIQEASPSPTPYDLLIDEEKKNNGNLTLVIFLVLVVTVVITFLSRRNKN